MIRKLLYLSTEDVAFCQHFLVMARAAVAAKLDVAVATKVRKHGKKISDEGIRPISLETERGSLSPIEAVAGIARMIAIIRREKPDIVHCIGLRMVLLGGTAARIAKARKVILAPTGLGHLWVTDRPTERIVRRLVRFVIGGVLRKSNVHFLFENREDPLQFGIDPNAKDVTIIGGLASRLRNFRLFQSPQIL